ncbi:Response regulator containing a CheY-like receiver domain and an HTH DNA-binding domain [Alteromonadaceae bacterium Bs31]|nr:Response regulator containing a CheY-like receiver domain and an HTH DNA-binding domain [Alteromonadaceae bacterium Bs31]
METNSTHCIWFIDDDPDDQYLFQHALETLKAPPSLRFFFSADELLEVITETELLPDLIVLDINLPGIDGVQALTQLKHTEQFCHIPVIIYTTSQARSDLADCYRMGANSVVIKKGSYMELVHAVESLCSYWFSVVSLYRTDMDEQRNNEQSQSL